MNDLVLFGQTAVVISIASLYAGLGELVGERSGVINLGLEGMMLCGALAATVGAAATGSTLAGALMAMAAGAVLACLHGAFAVALRANQVLSGLCLTMIGVGLAHFFGAPVIGKPGPRLSVLALPGLGDIPAIGPIFFRQTVLAYLAWLLVPATWFCLWRTRLGLKLRFCGENPLAAEAAGVHVGRLRLACVAAGGALAGLGGAHLSLVLTPGFKENMTGGQGFIALALVIFSGWRPGRLLASSLFFGALCAAAPMLAAMGLDANLVSPLRMLPYLATVAALALLGSRRGGGPAPAALGAAYERRG